MSRTSNLTRVALPFVALLLIALVAGTVRAQPQEDAPAQAPSLTPPELLEFVEAEYPAEAAERGEQAAVELEITISPDGTVSDARVVGSAGEAFDAAALEAVRQFRFEPARRDGEPIPARIRYRYVFEMREEPPPEEPPVEESEPAVPEPPPTAAPPEQEPVAPGAEEVEVIEDDVGFGATAEVEAPPREVTRRTITREELTRVPGTRGDALRTVELLPGVGRPPFAGGQLIVRGSAPGDSEVFLEGTPVPLLYHFGGLTSFYNSRMLERIDFYPGNFSARFGRKLGGILDVGVRDPATDRFHGVADVNLIDASFVAEGPIGDDASIAIAGRRSYIDFFFENVVPEDAFDVVAAPIYYDYQLIGSWKPTPKDSFQALVYGSSDRFALIFADPAEGDPEVRGDLDIRTQFHKVQLAWRRELSPDIDQDIQISAGPTLLDFSLGESLRFDFTFWAVNARAEWRARLSDNVRLIAGMDIQWTPFDLTFRGPPPTQGEGDVGGGSLSGADISTTELTGAAYRPASYVEADLRPVDPLRVVLGLRLDWYRDIQSWSFDPRMVAIWSVRDDLRIKGGVGIFSQPPEFQESVEELGNPNLQPIHAVHTGLGFEHDLAEGMTVGAEGFYKYLYDRVVSTRGGLPPRFTNEGIGRIYGLELSGRVQPQGRDWFGFFSYTLSRSERRDTPQEAWRLFDFDQTHILNVAGVYKLGKGWEVGGTFRLVTGNPETPIVGSTFNADTLLYEPLFGEVNSRRADWFHRLDVRVEKQWTFDLWKLAVYLDVQNVYNSTNAEGEIYNYDFSESTEVPGLPIIPSLGVRGEL